MENKRTFIALALIMLIFTVSNYVFKPKVKPKTKAKPAQVVTKTPKVTKNLPTTTKTNPEININSNIKLNNDIIVKNDFIKLRFSNKGATIKSVELIERKKNSDLFKFSLLNGKAVELLPQDIKHNNGLTDLALIKTVGDASGNTVYTKNLMFKHEFLYTNGQKSGINFYLENVDGTKTLTKRFVLKNEYEIAFDLVLENYPSHLVGYDLSFATGINDTESYTKYKNQDYKVVGSVNSEIEKKDLGSIIKKPVNWKGNFQWIAAKTKYFMLGIIPQNRVELTNVSAFSVLKSPAVKLNVRTNGGKIYQDSYTFYFGPIKYNTLKTYGNNFENVAELGWKYIRFLSRSFIWLFTFLQTFIPNYGIIMIIFAIVLKLILYPITHKTFESTHKMQKVQPYLNEINAKYKDNPQKRMQEMQRIYKEHGVNPLSGCLPMLLQMPIFFALYPVLRYAIELRQAKFFGWLTDLSEPDPLLILPILMCLFMLAQQFLMKPAAVDESKLDEKQLAQQKSQRMVMYVMPVMMFFIFKNLPSGLVLYWTFFSVLSMVQQIIIKKKFALK